MKKQDWRMQEQKDQRLKNAGPAWTRKERTIQLFNYAMPYIGPTHADEDVTKHACRTMLDA